MTASTEKGMKKETSCFLEKVFIKTRKRELPMLPHRFFSNDSCYPSAAATTKHCFKSSLFIQFGDSAQALHHAFTRRPPPLL